MGERSAGPVERFAAIGDVHGNWQALARAISASRRAEAELIVCVGDIAGHPEATNRCADILAGAKVVTVRGNHDRWLLDAIRDQPSVAEAFTPQTQQFLRDLPATAHFGTNNGACLVCHGVGQNDLGHFPATFLRTFLSRQRRLGRLSPETSVVVHGHSHRSRVDVLDGLTIVSVGRVSGDASTGCVLISNGGRDVTPLRY